jgi:hypothetical protein
MPMINENGSTNLERSGRRSLCEDLSGSLDDLANNFRCRLNLAHEAYTLASEKRHRADFSASIPCRRN